MIFTITNYIILISMIVTGVALSVTAILSVWTYFILRDIERIRSYREKDNR